MSRFLMTLVLAFAMASFASTLKTEASEAEVNWITIEEAQVLMQEEPRMVFVNIYTDWCSWCRRMKSETYDHPVIAEYLNDNFYAVNLNAEQEESIEFRGVEFENENLGERRPAHSFAIALLQGQMSYPSIAFFDENLDLLTAIPGFRPPANMEAVLAFFNDGVYKESPDLDAFLNQFEGTISE